MKVLVACEFSGTVREAFKAKGHDAWSCDLEDTEIPGQHYIGDVRDILKDGWDLMIAHPPCTYLALSGMRWMKDNVERFMLQQLALEFVYELWAAPISKKCIENPKSVLSTKFCRPTQKIQPWMFGHGETKETWLWLNNLPKLESTELARGRDNRIHRLFGNRKERSRTYQGIANAMAEQWG
jgi:hypothetical protein